ncbi:potassium-transporting ATPase alpha chain 2 [Ditylenchus destructor]|uniref:Potassium-transporting ATPase alpha chain 2 n=1 Tax=Ditylenchus destructor TaxID=166010 RepID=A0AAD4R0W9_9BILA|nr:potassium-transporting ATPase alpha chain 2 [Ditylenchus destructor]
MVYPLFNPSSNRPISHSNESFELGTKFQLYGPNKLPAPKEVPDWKLFLKQFMNLLWILLGVAAALTLMSYVADPANNSAGLWVAVILYVMIVVMCFISFYQFNHQSTDQSSIARE